MRSFLRAVRVALRYRFTIAAAMLCSLAVGGLWGANIGTIYPFLEIVFKGESLQESCTNKLAESEARSRELTAAIESLEREATQAPPEKRDSFDSEIAARKDRLAAEQQATERIHWYKPYVDRYLPRDPFLTLVLVIGVLAVGTILKSIFLVVNASLVARIALLTTYDIQNQFFRRALRLDVATFEQQRASGMVSPFVNEMRLVSGSIEMLFGQAVREPLKMFACLVGAAVISWRLLVLSMLVAPLGLILLRLLAKTIKHATQHSLNLLGEQIRRLTEGFGGIVTVKAFTLEAKERFRFRQISRDIAWMGQKLSFCLALNKPISEILGIGIISVSILAGTYLVLNEQTHLLGIKITERPLSPATLIVFYGMLAGISDPARKMSGIFGQLFMGITAARGVFAMMDCEPTVKDPPCALPLPRRHSELAFDNITFAYPGNEPVLRDIELHIPFGEKIAIVGPNGCGKSTLAKLLPRFYDPTAGAIRLDGEPLTRYRLRDLRSQIGYVTQETWLFDDDVADNIRCGKLRASDEEVIQAAQKAHAHEFIVNDLPHGYQTVVGQSGSRLSGGQRQRIALARAILRDPSILVLDEATSQIDLESEQLIYEALQKFMEGRTTILITHRLSALALVDRVVVMEQGRIIDCGSNEELAGRCEAFQRLHLSQLRDAA